MTRDPKQTQTMEEPRERSDKPGELDIALRTTLVQAIPLSRHRDFVRTRYWEKLSVDNVEVEVEVEAPKRSAASYGEVGKTCLGLGPDDPVVQAVRAAKRQLLEAERSQQKRASSEPVKLERTSHERARVAEVASASSTATAKTVRLPAFEVLQLMASRVESKVEAPAQALLPKRQRKPLFVAAGALSLIVCAAALGYFMPATPSEQSTLKPRPQAATETPQSATVLPAPGPAAPSVSALSQSPQLPPGSEKAAVDALFTGDYGLAGRHYTALASAHPEQPAFAEAARILKRNVQLDVQP